MPFVTQVDVANRALQHCGIPRITALTDSSKQAAEANFAIDKIRRAELRRSVWTFATQRMVLRQMDTTTPTKIVTFATYNAATTYQVGDVVILSNYPWICVTPSTVGITPGTSSSASPPWIPYFGNLVAQAFNTNLSYMPGDVLYVGAAVYLGIAYNPAPSFTPPNATYWHPIQGATLAAWQIANISPLGHAPTGTAVRNIFQLPANFIRIASQDPKAAAVARLGVSAGMQFNDWEIENGFIYTNDTPPLILRFVADWTNVANMDDLFCECWAAHLAAEIVEPLTQSREKLADIMQIYNRYLEMAKFTNAIEVGSTEPEIPEGGGPQAGQGGAQAAAPGR